MFDSAGPGENNQTFFFCGERTSSVKTGNHATISFLFFFFSSGCIGETWKKIRGLPEGRVYFFTNG